MVEEARDISNPKKIIIDKPQVPRKREYGEALTSKIC